MHSIRPEKASKVAELKEILTGAKCTVLVNYCGLTVADDTKLRSSMRAANIKYIVVKNTLLRIAAKEVGITGMDSYLEGPTAMAFSSADPVAPAKIITEFIKEMKLQNHVHFLGFITYPYPSLLNADLYILNSHSEGFSNSLVEAMYSKTPSLSTAVGAAPEIIEDGINGFLTPANDEEALYNKLKEIINFPKEELLEIGLAGHEKIVKNFSLENHVNELMKIYTNP